MKYINFSISYGIMTLESQKLQLKMMLDLEQLLLVIQVV